MLFPDTRDRIHVTVLNEVVNFEIHPSDECACSRSSVGIQDVSGILASLSGNTAV